MYTEEFITTEEAIEMIKRAPSDDYAGDLMDLYLTIAKKSELDKFYLPMRKLNSKGYQRFLAFYNAINPIRYALGQLTGGKVTYTSTNDLNSYYIH